jgi:sulfur-oxidizing protein SoxA
MNTYATQVLGKAGYSFVAGLLMMLGSGLLAAQSDDTFSEYRDMFGDDNPAIFVIEEGADFWLQANGPRQVSLEACDLGLGPGVVAGAYASLPRYFADTGTVMDLEARLLHCMTELQGRSRPQLLSSSYSGSGGQGTEMEALVTYIAEQSQGVALAVPQKYPQELQAYHLGEEIFFRRAGPYDFSCATCHRQDGKRIRLQELPNITAPAGAGFAYSGWPAYRISQGLVRTMGWRMQNCVRQQRLPQLQPGSPASVALQVYMGVNADGVAMAAPGLKR